MTKRIIIFLTSLIFLTGAFLNAQASKTLVVYFSWSGNSRTLADYAQNITGGDIFEIVPVEPYPNEHSAASRQAREELNNDYIPAMRNQVNNLSSYNVIILIYPNWWGTIPQIVKGFLQNNDFSGKTIAPLCTHAGARMGRSVEDIRTVCPNSTITEGLDVRGSSVRNAENDVRNWIRRVGIR